MQITLRKVLLQLIDVDNNSLVWMMVRASYSRVWLVYEVWYRATVSLLVKFLKPQLEEMFIP